MSLAALEFVMELKVTPSGHKLSSNEWSVLDYLAWRHNEEKGCAWPGVPTIAEARHLSVSSVSRAIRALSDKRVIAVVAAKHAKGVFGANRYYFIGLDVDDPGQPSRPRRRYNNLEQHNREAKTPHGKDDTANGMPIAMPFVPARMAEMPEPVRQECTSPCGENAQNRMAEMPQKRLLKNDVEPTVLNTGFSRFAGVQTPASQKQLTQSEVLSDEMFEARRAFLKRQAAQVLASEPKTQ